MSLFNKQGVEFTNPVYVDPDPNTEPVYHYKFPTLDPRGRVKEQWASKVRPIADLTKILQGCRLKRYQDYMIDYDVRAGKYVYWFLDAQYATLFALFAATLKQTHQSGTGQQFDIECPHCRQQFGTDQIIWR